MNTSSRVIRTLMYVIQSKFVFPRDVNPDWSHYFVSELVNAVELVDRIDTLDTLMYVCDVVYQFVVMYHAISV